MQTLPDIIGVTGYAQHGKNTLGDILVEQFGYTQVAFADTLKSMALVLDPIVYVSDSGFPERLSAFVNQAGWEAAKTNPEVRRFLQVLGTEAVRDHLGKDTWVEALFNSMMPGVRYVITDVRFPNEADAVLNRGGTMIRVIRSTEDGVMFDNGIAKDHPSEANIPNLPVDVTFVASDPAILEANFMHWATK